MRFTAANYDSHLPEMAYCRGANHSDSADIGWCDDCGVITARVTKTGMAPYLANTHHAGEFRNVLTYYCWSAHKCDPEVKRQHEAVKQERLAKGVVMKGAEVIVFKGRKVPIGTVGVVMWMGTDAWENEKVGLRVEGFEKLVYTAKSNVRSTAEEA